MPFRLFQTLLAAAFRLRTREHVMAINAAVFPHMDAKERERIAGALQAQSEGEKRERVDSTGDWDKLRGWATIDALQHPMKPREPKQEG